MLFLGSQPYLKNPVQNADLLRLSDRDKSLLRSLAEQQAEIAALPVHQETILGWQRINGLNKGRPMIWINEIPWHEMNVGGELTLQTKSLFSQWVETELRQTLYQWRHMPADMVVEPVFYCPLVVHDTGFGIGEEVDIVMTDVASDVVSRHFHTQIESEADLEKIRMPVVTYDAAATEQRYQALVDLLGDILKVEKRGAPGFWFAPWDELVRWWGVQEAMRDLVDRPELVHHAMDRLTAAYLSRLDQYEQFGLLSLNNNNVRVGSGGLGYTTELPAPGYDPAHVRTQDLWGCGAAQIFSAVSPRMHAEFALQYERRWLDRFGLNYYGCCDPLDAKISILKDVPNLRKISMSPFIKLERAIQNVGDHFVFSYKPSPAIFAEDTWSPQRVRQDLAQVLEKLRGCVVEIIMKDISTVRYQPQRLWEWAHIAAQLCNQ